MKVTLLAGTQSIVIDQTILSGGFSTFFALSSGFQPVFTATCAAQPGATISQSNGDVTVTWNAGTGGTFYISVTYNTTSLVGATKPSSPPVQYQFQTTGVPGSTSGLTLSKKR